MTAAPWFPGKGRDEDDEAFLAELRACADADGLVDATPADTSLHVWEYALVVLVALPGLQDGPEQPTLEVIADLQRGPDLMSGCETYGYLADSYEAMDLQGVEPTPTGLAMHAYGWFVAQLHRPVERAIWRTWLGSRSLVRFGDTGEPVWDHGARRRRERPPDELVCLR